MTAILTLQLDGCQRSAKREVCFAVLSGKPTPVKAGFCPNEIVNAEFDKAVMDFPVVLMGEIPDEPLNLFIADPLRI
jgi:hypothetical protein